MSGRDQVCASPQVHEIGGGEASKMRRKGERLIVLCGLRINDQGLFVAGGGGSWEGNAVTRQGDEDYSRCRRMSPVSRDVPCGGHL
jgi:hypothetical protein